MSDVVPPPVMGGVGGPVPPVPPGGDPSTEPIKIGDPFWVRQPSILFTSFNPFPTKDMTNNEKLNALTRLVLLVTAILYSLNFEYWAIFGLAGVLLIILIHSKSENTKEGFTLVPTYQGLDLQQTTVAPLFSEEWQIPPPSYDLNVMEPIPVTFDEPLTPQSYPYGQYLTRTNLLPSDEMHTHMLNGVREAREYANSSFLRNRLSFQDNMTKLYKKRLERRFRHNCNDSFSPYSSY